MTTRATRCLIDTLPFTPPDPDWLGRSFWPARWIRHPGSRSAPVVVGYRLRVGADSAQQVRVHVSADERYVLHLDGEVVGRGPDRGDPDHWRFETYDLELDPGPHVLAALVWSMGVEAPFAQFSRDHGFLLAAEGRTDVSTGSGEWESAELPGYATRPKGAAWGCGAKCEIDGLRYPWGWQTGDDTLDWRPAETAERACGAVRANDLPPQRLLVPTILPAQLERPFVGGQVRHVAASSGSPERPPVRAADDLADEHAGWQSLLAGAPVTIPAHTARRVLIDLETYVCAYPVLTLNGGAGAEVMINWVEALLEPDGSKGDRDVIEGKAFRPAESEDPADIGDRFVAGGGSSEQFTTLWWEAGRYVELLVRTGDEPLTVRSLQLLETHYPYVDRSSFHSSDPRLDAVRRLSFRTLQMCSHETAMDCPYYEQLQYAGDTRIQNLVAYLTTGDDRLARQSLLAFDASRMPTGLTASRYPSAIRQIIPPFSLWWIASVHDFALWRGDLDFVRTLMPGVRAVIEAHRSRLDDDGLLHALDGWNFTDWVTEWTSGVAPTAGRGSSAVSNFHLAHVAELAAQLETWLGEDIHAALDREVADRVRACAERTFWSAERGRYADDPAHEHWSEHAQCMAVLAGAAHGSDALTRALEDPDSARVSVYYTHYLFEALQRLGRADEIVPRLEQWTALVDAGLHTVIEEPEPTRSDCHAWGAHPLYHLVASVIGLRPVEPGMSTVSITPRPGSLEHAAASIPTPLGTLHLQVTGNQVTVEPPAGMTVSER